MLAQMIWRSILIKVRNRESRRRVQIRNLVRNFIENKLTCVAFVPHIYEVQANICRWNRGGGSMLTVDPISWLAEKGLYAAAFILCVYLVFWMLAKWPTPRRIMEDTFLQVQLYKKVERGKTVRKILPKLQSLETKDWGYVFKYRLLPGMSFQQFIDKKNYIDIAFGGEAYMTVKGNVLTIDVMKEILPNRVQYDLNEIKAAEKGEDIPLVLGCSKKGLKIMDLAEIPHCLVTGDSGTGKSVFVRQVLTSLIALRTAEQLQITMFDLKNGLELSPFTKTPHVLYFARDISGLESTLLSVRDLMNDRGYLFDNHGVGDIHEYNRKCPDDKLPFHLVVIDEMAEITDTKVIIERVIRRGRAYGVHLIMVSQRHDLVKLPFPMVVKFKVRNGVNKLPLHHGRAKVEFNGECAVQSLYISQQEARQIISDCCPEKRTDAE